MNIEVTEQKLLRGTTVLAGLILAVVLGMLLWPLLDETFEDVFNGVHDQVASGAWVVRSFIVGITLLAVAAASTIVIEMVGALGDAARVGRVDPSKDVRNTARRLRVGFIVAAIVLGTAYLGGT